MERKLLSIMLICGAASSLCAEHKLNEEIAVKQPRAIKKEEPAIQFSDYAYSSLKKLRDQTNTTLSKLYTTKAANPTIKVRLRSLVNIIAKNANTITKRLNEIETELHKPMPNISALEHNLPVITRQVAQLEKSVSTTIDQLIGKKEVPAKKRARITKHPVRPPKMSKRSMA